MPSTSLLTRSHHSTDAETEAALSEMATWCNNFLKSMERTTRDDDQLRDKSVRLYHVHQEIASAIASKSGWQPKTAVLCATIGNITLSGEQTIDGVVTNSSRVLVKDQDDAKTNGIYISSSGAWSRSSDNNTTDKISYAFVAVNMGIENGDTSWVVTGDKYNTLMGITDITFAKVGGTEGPMPIYKGGTGKGTGPESLTALGSNSSFGINIKDHPYRCVGDGVTDNHDAFMEAVAAIPEEGGVIYIPDGRFVIGDVTISRRNVKIEGPGTLVDSSITFDGMVPQTQMNCGVKGINFDFTTKTTGHHAVILRNAWYVTINDCVFNKPDACVYVPAIDYGQHTGRIYVTDNIVTDSDYLLFTDRLDEFSTILTSADMHVVNNVAVCGVCHVKGLGLDGLVMTSNTCFFPGYQGSDPRKQSNVHLDRSNWIVIQCNNLFEAGLESVYLIRCQNFNVGGNNIAWPGQRELRSAIKVTLSDVSGGPFSLGNIHHNNIQFPTKHGVEIDGTCGVIRCDANQILAAGNGSYYYGLDPIGSIDHYAICTAPTTTDVVASDNISPQNTNKIEGSGCYGFNNITSDYFKTITTAVTSITIDGAVFINIASPTPHTVSTITPPGFAPAKITITTYNGNTTIASNTGIVLKNGQSAIMPQYATLVLEYQDSKWIEVSRSFEPGVLAVTDNRTTLTVNGYQTVNLAQPTPQTITSISAGTLLTTKTITLFGSLGNTTIQCNSLLQLDNGVDVTIPEGGSLVMMYDAEKWHEVSRSFGPAILAISDNRTTIDLTGVRFVNLNQPDPTTITALTIDAGVQVPQVVYLVGITGNTTIANGSSIILAGGVNVTIPIHGVLTMIYDAGKWLEVSRRL